jgi:hypothetical protein
MVANLTSSDSPFVSEFCAQGFSVVSGLISNDLLARLCEAAETWIEHGWNIRQSGEPLFHHVRMNTPEGERIIHVEQLHRFGRIESLEVAALPEFRNAIEELCGPEPVWIFEGLNIRIPNSRATVPWMQDTIYDRAQKAVHAVLFLDDAGSQTEYCFLPGSQLERQDICELQKQRTNTSVDLICPALLAGDILFYDPMIARVGRPNNTDVTVRSLELWFESPDLARSVFPSEWIAERIRLYGLAAWTYEKIRDTSDEKRRTLYKTLEPDIAAIYRPKAVYPAANLCLDFKTGDRITSTT